MKAFWTIARHAFKEIVSVPVYVIALSLALIMIGIMPYFSGFAFDEELKLVADGVFSLTFLAGIFIATLSASLTVGNEYRRRTIYAVLTKPVGKMTFITAKYAGICAATALLFALFFVAGCTALKLVAFLQAGLALGNEVAIKGLAPEDWLTLTYFASFPLAFAFGGAANYFFKNNFAACTLFALCCLMGANGLFVVKLIGPGEALLCLKFASVIGLIFLAVCMMSSLSVLLVLNFELIGCIITALVIFLTGLMSEYLLGGGGWLATILYGLLPNWQHFWMADIIVSPNVLPFEYYAWILAYALVYSSVILALAALLTHRKDAV